jgi:hypothetical protein
MASGGDCFDGRNDIDDGGGEQHATITMGSAWRIAASFP